MHRVMPFSRTDNSRVSRWWWTVDRWVLLALSMLVLLGAIMTLTASPGAAERIGLDPLHFVRNQFAFLPFGLAILVAVSFLTPVGIRRLATIGFGVGSLLMLYTLAAGHDVNGARRWLSLGDFSLQPSELVKPCLAVMVAWVLARWSGAAAPRGWALATLLSMVVVLLLALQPDFGMALTVAVVWLVQLFLSGLPAAWVVIGVLVAFGAITAGYVFLPHVAARIDRYLDPSSGDSYQVDTSLRAFEAGGLLGRGPGEGVVKGHIPDAHTDFIFAVAGEELGVIACVGIIALFAFVVLRGFGRVARQADLFTLLAVAGLLTQFGLQALINMGVAVRLLPAKGMTLPFLSYGGSSMLATAIGMGMVLALTRTQRETTRGYAF